MNYYNPSYYMNSYPYSNQYPPISPQPSFQMSNNQPIVPSPQPAQPPSPQGLNGKIVDSEDVVRATEVPIGGYGIFPRADLSEIYIKSWNNNGTTSVITFKPTEPEASVVKKEDGELTNLLLQKIEILENKLDMFIAQPPQPQQQSLPVVEQTKKMEVITKNGF